MNNKDELINDKFEKDGIHLVCLSENQSVIGTGRINIIESVGVISQMAIKRENQKTGIGRKILSELILKCDSLGIKTIELSARESALDFYRKSGFKSFGNKYPSTKTGIIHQKMAMNLNNVSLHRIKK